MSAMSPRGADEHRFAECPSGNNSACIGKSLRFWTWFCQGVWKPLSMTKAMGIGLVFFIPIRRGNIFDLWVWFHIQYNRLVTEHRLKEAFSKLSMKDLASNERDEILARSNTGPFLGKIWCDCWDVSSCGYLFEAGSTWFNRGYSFRSVDDSLNFWGTDSLEVLVRFHRRVCGWL